VWWPLCFLFFVYGAANGDVITAGRAFVCLLVLSRAGVRDFCVR
jgi:hypothetical protein